MRNGLLGIMGVWVFTASLAAQTPPPPPNPPPPVMPSIPANSSESLPAPLVLPPNPPPAVLGLPRGEYGDFGGPPPAILVSREAIVEPVRFWVKAEYLSWWVKDAPLPGSLVTRTDPNTGGDVTVFGSNVQYDAFSGARIAMGGWFDRYNNIGLEGNVFFLGRRSNDYVAASDNGGNPALALSFFSRTPGATGEYVMPITTPGQFAGNIQVSSALELWGTEVNGAFCLLRRNDLEFTLLTGFRYADLQEKLGITAASIDLSSNNVSVLQDQFHTRNQFYGGQLGARFGWQGYRLAFEGTAKVALGATHEVVDIQGYAAQFGPSLPATASTGGLFAQNSNIGRATANQFTVLPSLELKLSYLFTPRCRFFVGYDFMYWSQVVRPGNQIDRNVNLTQSPVFGTGVLSGPAYPTPLFSRSDFWAQGITFGFEFRF